MKIKTFFSLVMMTFGFSAFAQVQNAAQPKDAQIDVLITDTKKNILPHEIVIFRSDLNGREYQGVSDSVGRFSLRLPAGDKYDISVLGFKDTTSNSTLEIPALKPGTFYKDPFKVDVFFTPSKTFELEGLNFDFGKATLQPGSEAVLDELVNYLNRKTDEKIEVGGHTDNIGSAAKNLALSQERAATVVTYLISKGIDPSRLTAKGYGMAKPVSDNRTEEGRADNRRTEVTVL